MAVLTTGKPKAVSLCPYISGERINSFSPSLGLDTSSWATQSSLLISLALSIFIPKNGENLFCIPLSPIKGGDKTT